jgi:hypothetical protein
MAKVELSSGVIGLRFVKRVEYVRFSEPVHGQPLNRRMRIGTLPGGMSTRKKPRKNFTKPRVQGISAAPACQTAGLLRLQTTVGRKRP